MYKKDFEIRWSDVDANGHLANSAYTNFMSHTRMGFFIAYGFSMQRTYQNLVLDLLCFMSIPIITKNHL